MKKHLLLLDERLKKHDIPMTHYDDAFPSSRPRLAQYTDTD